MHLSFPGAVVFVISSFPCKVTSNHPRPASISTTGYLNNAGAHKSVQKVQKGKNAPVGPILSFITERSDKGQVKKRVFRNEKGEDQPAARAPV